MWAFSPKESVRRASARSRRPQPPSRVVTYHSVKSVLASWPASQTITALRIESTPAAANAPLAVTLRMGAISELTLLAVKAKCATASW